MTQLCAHYLPFWDLQAGGSVRRAWPDAPGCRPASQFGVKVAVRLPCATVWHSGLTMHVCTMRRRPSHASCRIHPPVFAPLQAEHAWLVGVVGRRAAATAAGRG